MSLSIKNGQTKADVNMKKKLILPKFLLEILYGTSELV